MSGNVGKSENVEISYNERGQRFHWPRRIDMESHCQNSMFMIIIQPIIVAKVHKQGYISTIILTNSVTV